MFSENESIAYSDTSVTKCDKRICSIIDEVDDDDYTKIISDAPFDVFYHLSDLRTGIISWYDFRVEGSALEIGAGFGELTGCLCHRLTHVTALEKNEFRVTTLKRRCRFYDNLDVRVGDLSELKDDERFDYIILAGGLETSCAGSKDLSVYASFLRTIRKFLQPDGVLLIAVENRLGLKYFCGARTPYDGMPFRGIRNQSSSYGRTFAKHELEEIVREAGWSDWKFYYPLPDWHFPQIIYTDEHLPKRDLHERLVACEPCHETLLADENVLYDDIIANGTFPSFSNSFLIECGSSKNFSKIEYAALSTDRGRDRAFATIIWNNGYVTKQPIFDEGRDYAKSLVEKTRTLSGRGVKVVPQKWDDRRGVVMPKIDAPRLQEVLRDCVKQGNRDAFLKYWERLWDIICNSSPLAEAEENALLGPDGLPYGPILRQAYLELMPMNCFCQEDGLTFFDQEYVRDNYPAKYVLFRGIKYLYMFEPEAQQLVPLAELQAKFGLIELWDLFMHEENDRFLHEVRQYGPYAQFYRWSTFDDQQMQRNAQLLGAPASFGQAPLAGAAGKKLIVFGAGYIFDRFLRREGQAIPPYMLVDNDSRKWGKLRQGVEIHSPADLLSIPDEEKHVLLCTRHWMEIGAQLGKMGVRNWHVYPYSPSGTLYSFSIYGTLLTHGTATHEGIFALMQEALKKEPWRSRLPEYVRENFYELRLHAERNARFVSCVQWKKGDTTLVSIYEALGNIGFLSMNDLRALADLEKRIALEQTSGATQNIAYVRKLLSQGEQVVLMEDTYWDHATVSQQLSKVASDLASLPIYLSSECPANKRDGSLFWYVREKEGANISKWEHVGSNHENDVTMPEKIGIRTRMVESEPLLPIERDCLAGNMANATVQQVIGISRNLRAAQGSGKTVPWQIGSSEIGPLLYAYVRWVLQDAMERHLRRLYFIARDGYILQQIADTIIAVQGLPLETYYIYGSRSAWRMQSYDGGPGSLRRLIAVYFPDRITSVAKFSHILRIPLEDLLPYLPQEYHKTGRHWSKGDVAICVQHLEDNESFRVWYKERMRPNRERVVAYLRQEIDVSGGAFAFVDVLGGGYTENCLAELMSDVHAGDNLMYLLRTDAIYSHPRCVFLNFLPTKTKGELIFELSCRALHQQTEDYRKENGRMVPVFSKDSSEPLRAYGYEDFLKGVRDYAKARAVQKDAGSVVDLSWFSYYLSSLVEHPDEKTLAFFGDMPYNTTGRNSNVQLYAPRLTKQNIRDVYLWHADKPWEWYYPGNEIDFALLRCTSEEQRLIQRYKKNRTAILERYERFTRKKLPRPSYDFKQQLRTMLPLFAGRRIVLYGAGKYGRRVHRYLHLSGHEPVQWLDKGAARLQAQGRPVDGDMTLLGQVAYDVVLIAVLDKQVAAHIKEEMSDLGVPENKIFGIIEALQYVNRYFSEENLYPRMYRIKLQ